MATNKATYIDDIILQATGGNPSDDHEIEREQIALWIDDLSQALKRAEIEEEIKAGRSIPQVYVAFEDCEEISIEDIECLEENKDRFYITITGTILDLPNDRGLIRVLAIDEDDNVDDIRISTVEQMDDLRGMRFTKPSSHNPVAYRQGNKIYIEGIKSSEVDFNKISVFYVERQDIFNMAETAEIKLSDKIRILVKNQVVDKLKLQLYGSQQDVANDGVWVPQAAYHNLISKVQRDDQVQ